MRHHAPARFLFMGRLDNIRAILRIKLEPFCKLADPSSYTACNWNLCEDHPARAHWVGFFKRHLETILKLGTTSSNAAPHAAERTAACRREYLACFDRFAVRPHDYQNVTILTLDAWRDGLLRKYGFEASFLDPKNCENAAALPL